MYRVMLAEDDKTLRYIYSKMNVWEKHGFRIDHQVANGNQAVEYLRDHQVDVIFTDICMPFLNGFQMMEIIKKQYPDMPFVLVSSYNKFEYAIEGLRMGAVDYVVKPMEEKDLERVLKRLVQLLKDREHKSECYQILQKILPKEVDLQEPFIENICYYLDEHMQENLTLAEIAAALQLNKDYLGKLIKSHTGMNFRTLYNQLKIEYAKPLIKSGQYKVYEISEMLGYTSSDYFTRLFKNIMKMTPAEYKKQR